MARPECVIVQVEILRWIDSTLRYQLVARRVGNDMTEEGKSHILLRACLASCAGWNIIGGYSYLAGPSRHVHGPVPPQAYLQRLPSPSRRSNTRPSPGFVP